MWILKILVKIIVSKLPLRIHILKKMGLFKTGRMYDVHYAINIALEHFKWLPVAHARRKVLEVGPGDGLYSSTVAFTLGFDKCLFVDIYPHAEFKETMYNEGCKIVMQHLGSSSKSIDYVVAKNSISYLTNGLHSLKLIESNSIDFIWSHVVLQHVYLDELDETLSEFNRILNRGGRMSHRVDLKDCISFGLNNLRFNKEIWESTLFRSSGFYTNRLRVSDWLLKFSNAGFKLVNIETFKFDALPIEVSNLSKDFQNYSEDELLTSGCHLVFEKFI